MLLLHIACIILNVVGFGILLCKGLSSVLAEEVAKFGSGPYVLTVVYFITYLITLTSLGMTSPLTISFMVLATVIWFYVIGSTPKPRWLKYQYLCEQLEIEVIHKFRSKK